ncbi:MAG: patatin-like phospholipase family protein [Pseudomonadales bacterium]|nr:patatin-like phospholipase family protein [Pseudomonadales bacterium]
MTYPSQTLADWLAAKPFTLAMSSGFFGFFAHFGVVKALQEHGLTPARLCGSSAGALVACSVASGSCMTTLEQRLLRLDKGDFWDPSPGLGLLRGQAFRSVLADILPIRLLDESPRPVALSVWHGRSQRTRVLRDGDAVEAVYASCAVPLLFQPASINGERYWDGGIADRHGLAATWPGERVLYHHLQSRSPWRRANSAALLPPIRPNLMTLAIDGLLRAGPNRLNNGRVALEQAYSATQQALSAPLSGRQVTIQA